MGKKKKKKDPVNHIDAVRRKVQKIKDEYNRQIIAGENPPATTEEYYRRRRAKKARNRAKSGGAIPKRKKYRRPSDTSWVKELSYLEYLKSPWWKSKRTHKFMSVNGKCESCGGKATECHHLHYRSLGREKNSHLVALCNPCHRKRHPGWDPDPTEIHTLTRPTIQRRPLD